MPDTLDKKADLAGPGISTCEEVAKILPSDCSPLLNRKDTQKALHDVKRIIEEGPGARIEPDAGPDAADRDRRERRERLLRLDVRAFLRRAELRAFSAVLV